MKKVFRTAALGLAALVSLSGLSAQANPPVSGEVSLVVDNELRAPFTKFIKKFNEVYPNVTVTPLFGKDQNLLIAAHKAPDLLKAGDTQIVAAKDQMLPLDSLLTRDGAEVDPADFSPGALAALQVEGRQLAMPTFFNVGLLYYNKRIFQAAGVPLPTAQWTQKEFLDAAKRLTRQTNGKVSQWGASTVLGWWGEWLIHVRQAGGDWMKDGKNVLDSPEGIAGLQFFFDKTTKGAFKVAPSPTDDALGGFAGGKTAMEYGGHTGMWVSFNKANLDWDIEVLPSGLQRKAGAEFAVDAYGISKGTKNPEAAWALLKFWTGKEGIAIWSELGRPIVRKSVAAQALAVPKDKRPAPQNLEALYAAVGDGMTLPKDPNFINATQQIVQPVIDKMLEGKISPADAAQQAADKANTYLAANRRK